MKPERMIARSRTMSEDDARADASPESPADDTTSASGGGGGEASGGSGRRGRSCPICGKPTVQDYRPFCSKRCADVDLHKWLGGGYAIPVVEEDGSAGDGGPDPED